MKIRIKGNSVRYRLTQSEVARLGAEGFLEEKVDFAGKKLIYSIITAKHNKLSVEFTGNMIALHMSKVMIEELCNTDKVGFGDTSGHVSLLVEKDFVCIDKVEEDQSDNYPNPNLAC